jgi:hypothetical protein
MLNKIKRFLTRKDPSQENPEEEEDGILGSITYYFKESDDNIYMDIHLSDYKKETISKFAKVISGLSSLKFQLETLNMIRDCFDEGEDEDVFTQIVTQMIKCTEEETSVLEKINRKVQEQPWIKPSDMIN